MSTGIGDEAFEGFRDVCQNQNASVAEEEERSRTRFSMSAERNIGERWKKSLRSRTNERTREGTRANHMAFMTAGSGDESDKQFRDEDARDHQRNRGKRNGNVEVEEIRESNMDT